MRVKEREFSIFPTGSSFTRRGEIELKDNRRFREKGRRRRRRLETHTHSLSLSLSLSFSRYVVFSTRKPTEAQRGGFVLSRTTPTTITRKRGRGGFGIYPYYDSSRWRRGRRRTGGGTTGAAAGTTSAKSDDDDVYDFCGNCDDDRRDDAFEY